MRVRLSAALREKHRITACEFAQASRVSRQRLVQIESWDNQPTEHMETLIRSAFQSVIERRRRNVDALEADYLRCRDRLLEYIREDDAL